MAYAMIEQPSRSEPELETEIEELELHARDLRSRVEAAADERNHRVLKRQVKEVEDQIERLRARLR
jgi:hypothetical protein